MNARGIAVTTAATVGVALGGSALAVSLADRSAFHSGREGACRPGASLTHAGP